MTMIGILVSGVLLCAVLFWALMRNKNEDLSQFESDIPVTFPVKADEEGLIALEKALREVYGKSGQSMPSSNDPKVLAATRARFEEGSLARDFPCAITPTTFQQDGLDLDGEWVCAPGADPDKRILYIHGGAFRFGSAVSHRPITSSLSELTGASVFAVNYRLLPEHKRVDCVADCQAATKWIADNGPNGAAKAKTLVVSGDSAGGNLALVMTHWARDNAEVRQFDAVYALSPLADNCFTGQSIATNIDNDILLGSLIRPVIKTPQAILNMATKKELGIDPANPIISPLYAKLNDLPPIILQASASETLYSDSVRYFNKAKAAGVDIKLQSWDRVPHVWQIFDLFLPQSKQALSEAAKFLKDKGAV